MTVEREISSIETANINKETLDAMKGASQAMKTIHGDLSIDKVDQTMETLRDQHAISQEIAEALTQGNMNGVDEDELDEELAELQQEALDKELLKTGSVPVSDHIHSLPNAAKGERKSLERKEHDRLLLLLLPLVCKSAETDMVLQSPLQAKESNKSKRTTRRRSYGSFKQRWLCNAGNIEFVARGAEEYSLSGVVSFGSKTPQTQVACRAGFSG